MLLIIQLCSCVGAENFPIPDVQTQVQKTVISEQAAKAKLSSEAATPKVLALFDAASFRAGLLKCCPKSAHLPATQLLEQFRAEVRVAELAHSFPSGYGKASHFVDITIPLARQYKWFLNEWQAPMITKEQPPLSYNLAEEAVFGLPPFVNNSQPTWSEAADRLIYIAQNLHQLDTGSLPIFGEVTAIFRGSYVKDMVLIAAVDTGMYEMSCNKSIKPSHWHPLPMNCSAYSPPVVGTLDHFDHIIIPNLGLWTNNETTVEDEALKLFSRSAFAENYLKMPSITELEAMKYYEANLLGNPRIPDAVSFLIGNFYALFGTDAGKELQLLAGSYSWPLVWGLGAPSTAGKFGHKDQAWSGNQRILDPILVPSQALNATTPAGAETVFMQVWNKVAARRKNPFPIQANTWLQWWSTLAASQARLAPLTARAGCSEDSCIGIMAASGECVCKRAESVLV